MHQPSKLKVSCGVHLARSSPAPTISTLLNSCSGPATYWRMCKCCVTYLLTSSTKWTYIIIEKYDVNWKMHIYADNTQLYDHLWVNTIERSEACLQDIVQWRLKLSKTELIWFWLDRGHSIEKFQQQPLIRDIRLNSQQLSSSSSVRDLRVIIGSGLTLTVWRHTTPSWQERVSISCEEFDRQRKTWTKTISKHQSAHLFSHVWTTDCNSVLANLPEVTLAPLIRIQHSAARLRQMRLFIRGPWETIAWQVDPDNLSNYRPIRVVHGSDGPAGRVGSGHDFAGFWRVGSGRVSTSDF